MQGFGALTRIHKLCAIRSGLAVYLGIDAIRAQIHTYNAEINVGGIADAGFFSDYSSSLKTPLIGLDQPPPFGFKAAGDPPLWYLQEYDVEARAINYSASVRHTFDMMNVSAGAPAECLGRNARTPSNCMFAEHLLPVIQSPLLVLQV